MPVFDWQFLVVTIAAAGAGSIVLRRLLPARKVRAPALPVAACSHCASADAPSARPARTETVPVVSIRDLRASAHQSRTPQNQAR
jgi:hypothetical protein